MRKKQILLSGLLFLFMMHLSTAFDPTVITKIGPIRGFTMKTQSGKEISAFTGIPYAKPPIGKLRFKPPEPLKLLEFDFSAKHSGILCPQPNLLSPTFEMLGDENCLILNVYSSSLTASPLLPVFFWIHGGFFTVGSSDPKVYGPEKLLEENVVLVTINYRLGPFGFLSTGDRVIRGNMGLKDQHLALKWVNDHIIGFGGDPHRVILFGEDAGAASAFLHMIAPISKGLFHAVIAQSGSPFAPHFLQRVPLSVTTTLVKFLNCDILGEMFLFACLVRMPAVDILAATVKLGIWKGFPPLFAPVVDNKTNEFLPIEPLAAFKSGNFYRVPVITGISKDEAALLPHFLQLLGDQNSYNQLWLETFIDKTLPILANLPSEEALFRVNQEYFTVDMTTEAIAEDAIKQCLADCFFNAPNRQMIRLLNRFVPVFTYIFAYRGEEWLGDQFGFNNDNQSVGHGDEILYLFGDKIKSNNDLKISKKLVKLWLNFALYSDPTPYAQPVKWNAIILDLFEYLLLDNWPPKIVKTEYRLDKIRFWNIVIRNLRAKISLKLKGNSKMGQSNLRNFISKTLPNTSSMIRTGINKKMKVVGNLSSEPVNKLSKMPEATKGKTKAKEPVGPLLKDL